MNAPQNHEELTETDEPVTDVVPEDLREWADEPTLLAWLEEELRLIGFEHQPDPVKASLGLMAFSYLRGTYEHEEVARHGSRFASLPKTSLPPEELTGLLHKHRDLLIKLLVQVLIKARRQKFALPKGPLEPAVRKLLQQDAVDRVDNAILLNAPAGR